MLVAGTLALVENERSTATASTARDGADRPPERRLGERHLTDDQAPLSAISSMKRS